MVTPPHTHTHPTKSGAWGPHGQGLLAGCAGSRLALDQIGGEEAGARTRAQVERPVPFSRCQAGESSREQPGGASPGAAGPPSNINQDEGAVPPSLQKRLMELLSTIDPEEEQQEVS